MKSLFETNSLQEITDRINFLNTNSTPNWGKMNVGQMLKHCQVPFGVIDGTVKMENKVGFFKKLIFSLMKPLMYNDKPWKKNIPTGKEFIIRGEVNFEKEKEALLKLVTKFHDRKTQTVWPPHPVFGKFTKEQYGMMNYKHLDHHLMQFGV
jgi:hypothetical protein